MAAMASFYAANWCRLAGE